jgi:hypothetical protein
MSRLTNVLSQSTITGLIKYNLSKDLSSTSSDSEISYEELNILSEQSIKFL